MPPRKAGHRYLWRAQRRLGDTDGKHDACRSALEERLAAFLGYADCTLFPTGWGAGYGVIKALVTEQDHVLIDVLAHACLQEGARNATSKVHHFPHLSNDGVRRRLERIRQEDPQAGILVVTETVFSMDSDVPDIGGLQALCNRISVQRCWSMRPMTWARLAPQDGAIWKSKTRSACPIS